MEIPIATNRSLSLWPLDKKYFYYTRYNTSSNYVTLLIAAITFVTIPVISLLGVAGNVFTICVLKRHGFRKSYNIFILSLAIADTFFLFGVNNLAKILYDKSSRFGFYYSTTESMILYVMFIIQIGLELNGKFMAMILPTFISFERFVAVYFPLHLRSMITSRRAKLAVVIVFISWIPANVYFNLLLRFEYINDPQINQTIGYILRSDLMLNYPDVYKIISGFFFMISGPVPVIFVIIICVAIGVKVHSISKERKKLMFSSSHNIKISVNDKVNEACDENRTAFKGSHCTQNVNDLNETKSMCKTKMSKDCKSGGNTCSFCAPKNGDARSKKQSQKSVSQTTLMLLSMCIVYSIIVTSTSVPSIIFNRDTWESDTGAVVELCSQLAVSINCSSNFLIYVALNRNFRTTFKNLIRCG